MIHPDSAAWLLQRWGRGHSFSRVRLPGLPAQLPGHPWLDYRASRVHLELSFLGHLERHRIRRGAGTPRAKHWQDEGEAHEGEGRWRWGGWGAGTEGGVGAPRLGHMSRAGWAWGPRDILEIFTYTQWTWLQNYWGKHQDAYLTANKMHNHDGKIRLWGISILPRSNFFCLFQATPPPPSPSTPAHTPQPPSFDLVPALLCWSSNHNPGPWQMEDRSEKLLTSQPEPLLSAHQLLPASPPSPPCLLPPPHTHHHLLWGQSILLGNGTRISPYLATLERTWKHNRWMFFSAV